MDSPNGFGIRRVKGYMLFFKWNKHFYNYQTDFTDDNFQLQGYYPIRYQTKSYH
jgi:hypothetical protein